MDYLKNLDFTADEITVIRGSVANNILEMLEMFPMIVTVNYNYLKNIGVSNHKDIFTKHAHMFLINPDRFSSIFEKYDHDDLVRCLEKNAAVIEKL